MWMHMINRKMETWRLPLTSSTMDPRFHLVMKKPLVIWLSIFAWHLSEKIIGLKMIIEPLNPSVALCWSCFYREWSHCINMCYSKWRFYVRLRCSECLFSSLLFWKEFGLENVGKHTIIVSAIYESKSSGADYWRHVYSTMEKMGFSSYKDDPDVWLQPSLKVDAVENYQCVLLSIDDVLAIME